jgi:hypothetical protein
MAFFGIKFLNCVVLVSILAKIANSAAADRETALPAGVSEEMEYGDNWGSPIHHINHYKGPSLKELTKNCDWKYEKFENKVCYVL